MPKSQSSLGPRCTRKAGSTGVLVPGLSGSVPHTPRGCSAVRTAYVTTYCWSGISVGSYIVGSQLGPPVPWPEEPDDPPLPPDPCGGVGGTLASRIVPSGAESLGGFPPGLPVSGGTKPPMHAARRASMAGFVPPE